MEALILTRDDYDEGLEHVRESAKDKPYLDKFKMNFPDGLNTANVIELCKLIQNPDFDSKVKILKICIRGKNVLVTCPNGEEERFCMNNTDDNLEAFPLFQKEPLALIALADSVYGYLLKKYIRQSTPEVTAGKI